MSVEQIRLLLRDSPELRAFLRLIREGESSQDDDAYWWLYGSTRKAPKLAESLDAHPNVRTYEKYDGEFIKNGKLDFSTAAGAYQITETTWRTVVQPALRLPDFRPKSQDAAAVFLLAYRRALDHVLAGRPRDAIPLLRDEWASMPGAAAGDQPTQRLDAALRIYEHWLARERIAAPAAQNGEASDGQPVAESLAPGRPADGDGGVAPTPAPIAPQPPMPAGEAPDWPPPPTTQETPAMAPILAAVLPSIVQAIPKLGELFGSGSQVAQRNVKAAEAVVGIVTQAVGAVNAQDAAERVQRDPAARVAAQQAVEQRWFEITSDAAPAAKVAEVAFLAAGYKPLQSPSMWALLALLPLAYMVVGSVVGLWGAGDWSPDVRAAISTAVVSLIIGGAAGYYWGATTTRNRPSGAS